MPLSMQVKLLRFLQTGEVRPVGDETTRYVDVRADVGEAVLHTKRPVPVQVDGDFIGHYDEIRFKHHPDKLRLARTDLLP